MREARENARARDSVDDVARRLAFREMARPAASDVVISAYQAF